MKLGFYSHYKGGLYLAIYSAKYTEDPKQNMVLYLSLHYWTTFIRPENMWLDPITLPDGSTTTRFKKVGLLYALRNLKWKKHK